MRTLSLNLALLLASLFSAPALCAQTSTPLRLQQPLPPRTRSSSSWFQFPDWRRFVFEQLAHHEPCVLVEMWDFSKFPRTDGFYFLPRGLNRPLNHVLGEWTKCDPYVRGSRLLSPFAFAMTFQRLTQEVLPPGRVESSPIHQFSMMEQDASSGRTKFRLIVRYNRDTQEPLCLDLFDAGGEHGTKVGQILVEMSHPLSRWWSSGRGVRVRSDTGETVIVPDNTVMRGCLQPTPRFRKAFREYYAPGQTLTFKLKFTYTYLHRSVMNWMRAENVEPEMEEQGLLVSISRRFRKVAQKFTFFSLGFFVGRLDFEKICNFDPKKAAMAMMSDVIHSKLNRDQHKKKR